MFNFVGWFGGAIRRLDEGRVVVFDKVTLGA